MQLLIVEDDTFKYSRIERLAKDSVPEIEIFRADSVCDAVNYLNEKSPDIIILDMSLPSHSPKAGEGTPLAMPAGGVEVIMEIDYLGKNDIPVMILTQYADIQIENDYFSIDDAGMELRKNYSFSNLEVVFYEDGSEEWIDKTKFFLGV
ncbi:hypothetical protein A3754_19080 [Alcanivorax sp. HI0083]|uniref:response regulator n=1 Tax=unclassified Alcanivorax TaxID=2638842 RepID=UPI0007B92A14|nr:MULTISPECIES: response regulator [unclassified Alcanivorax]KZY33843.1 hypothetical protein A3730_17220 [Alcanivorax sp. HI0044]KZZ23156.1 hypothetical protein A3754_19080 [Alcanivorax sp. HI0083]